MLTNLSALIRSGHLHHADKLVVEISFFKVSLVFREILVVNPKHWLPGILISCYVKGRS